ncbi:DUF1549 domain-containing protein [Rhodopirellula sp. MGV]|uniref:DUF1549 domain-containing protein n=1 Tax=Rhodopirellula sp. MGV TaxID=2023130 RepID=UPI000B974237|nr:DUF1549 domain-containing protein [Rhodopirellula sp. MGV]OYP28356.1 hypothetical protein CGZ80_26430 [Rhodopirellula sp. MGV]PNY38768.1 DUF1553 domain-containing protein [Rhodopirellula baltica]
MKRAMISVAKWAWFGLLMLIAFGYMASGLSKPGEVDENETPTGVRQVSAENAVLDGAEQLAETRIPTLDAAAGASSAQLNSSESVDSIESVVDAVNLARQQAMLDAEVESAPTADWMTICRRLSLAMVGSGMSLEEIRHLESLPASERESAHLESLLHDGRFHDYWGERWMRYLVNDEGPFLVFRRRRFGHWLSENIAANRPYDAIVRDLITAEGLWTDRPQVNFLTVTFDSNDGSPDPVRLAARTCRAFLGLRIDCLQCHDDFLGNVNLGDADDRRGGRQQDFHQLAAFYSSAKTNGLQGVRTEDVDYKFQYLDADDTVDVEATVPYQSDLLPQDGNPRERLAHWVTHPEHRQFSRAAIHRFWALMFGRSITDAVDNLPLDEAANPVLDPIIEDFQSHRDIHRTIRIIAATDAFRADSKADYEITARHENNFAAFPLTRLRAEQVAGAITQASKIKSIDRQSSLLVQLMRFGAINDFLKRYGDLGENEFSKDGITIPQRLMMLNGNVLNEAAKSEPLLNTTGHLKSFAKDDSLAVDVAFLCLLNRHASEAEVEYFADKLQQADGRGNGLVDLFWMLANSTEFAWNH